MKQIIVLIATIILGVSLTGVVTGMGNDVGKISEATTNAVKDVLTSGTAIQSNYDALTKQ